MEQQTPAKRAARPYVLGAVFVWALAGAVALATYSSREPHPRAALAALPPAAPSNLKAIVWENSFEDAMQRARTENKPLLIDFYTDWCSVCKQLDKNVLPNKAVISESANWVSIRINAEKRPDVAGQYGVTGYPTIVFAETTGKPLSILPGYADASEFVGLMQDARAKFVAAQGQSA